MNQKQSFAEIKLTYKTLQTLDAKKRFYAIKALAHTIYQNYKKNTSSADQMELYIKIMKAAIRLHGNKYSKFLTRIIGDWLEATGAINATIITKVSGKIDSPISFDSGSGIIAVGDPVWFNLAQPEDIGEIEYLSAINRGEFFIFQLEPAEEPYNVQIRIIDAVEPVLTAKEFKCVLASSETAIIHIPSNRVMAAEPQELDIPGNQVAANITPGNYKICVYHFQLPKKLERFYIVLCKTDEAASNNLLNMCSFLPANCA